MALYIASDSALPLIPWDDASPAFHVLELRRDPDERVRQQFTKPFIVYAGSDEGCGCGFFKLRDGEYLEPDEVQACRESLRRLGDYLDAAMARSSELELFTSWEGEQGEPPEVRRSVTVAAIRSGVLEDHQRQWCRVVADDP